MNSSATLAHLQRKMHVVAGQYARSKDIANRAWDRRGEDTRIWHAKNARLSLERMARLEHAIIYLGIRMDRGRGAA